MILLKLNLVNKKISNFFKLDINALAWIFVGVITTFIIIGTYASYSDDLKEEYSNNFPIVEVESAQISVEKTVQPYVQTNEKAPSELIIFMIFIFFISLVFVLP